MALFEYGITFPDGYDSSRIASYENEALLEARDSGLSPRNLLMLLGDYWTDQYKDMEMLRAIQTGAATLISEEYQEMLRLILGSSIVDFPLDTTGRVNLFVFDASLATYIPDGFGGTEYISYPMPELKSINALTDRLFEPAVVLEKEAYFDVVEVDGIPEVRFYVDIFQDENILKTASNTLLDRRIVLLWGSDVLYKERLVYERFGRFLYTSEYDSQDYHFLIDALQQYYISTKSIKNIETMINILMGVPYARYDDETIVTINIVTLGDRVYNRIVTNYATYYAPFFADLTVLPGTTVNKLDLLCQVTMVYDYITKPTWYEKCKFPSELIVTGTHPGLPEPQEDGTYDGIGMESNADGDELERDLYRLIDQILKYNLILIKTNYSEEFSDMTYLPMAEIFKVLVSGLPVYLYPIIQGSIGVLNKDYHMIMDFTLDELLVDLTLQVKDKYSMSRGVLCYDGAAIYDGTYTYDSELDSMSAVIHLGPDTSRWHGFTHESYWDFMAGSAVADGFQAEEVDGVYSLILMPAGNWVSEYLPRGLRMYPSVDSATITSVNVQDTAGNNAYSGWEYTPMSEILLDIPEGEYLAQIQLESPQPFLIENLTFFFVSQTFANVGDTTFENIGGEIFENLI